MMIRPFLRQRSWLGSIRSLPSATYHHQHFQHEQRHCRKLTTVKDPKAAEERRQTMRTWLQGRMPNVNSFVTQMDNQFKTSYGLQIGDVATKLLKEHQRVIREVVLALQSLGLQVDDLPNYVFGLAYLYEMRNSNTHIDEKPAGEQTATTAGIKHELDWNSISESVKLAHIVYDGSLEQIRRKLSESGHECLFANTNSTLERPAYMFVYNHSHKEVRVVVRGTKQLDDMITNSLQSGEVFYSPVTGNMEACHQGMFNAAKWLKGRVSKPLADLFVPLDYKIITVGHSLGGGVAALLSYLLNQDGLATHSHAFATPCCTSLRLSRSLKSSVTSIVWGDDMIPRINAKSLETLKLDIDGIDWDDVWKKEVEKQLGSHKAKIQGLLKDVENTLPRWAPFQASQTQPSTEDAAANAAPVEKISPSGGELSARFMDYHVPGQVVHLTRSSSATSASEEVRVEYVDTTVLEHIQLSPTLLSDHRCSDYETAVKRFSLQVEGA